MRNGGPNTEIVNIAKYYSSCRSNSSEIRTTLARFGSLTTSETRREIIAALRFAAEKGCHLNVPLFEGRPRKQVSTASLTPKESARTAQLMASFFGSRVRARLPRMDIGMELCPAAPKPRI